MNLPSGWLRLSVKCSQSPMPLGRKTYRCDKFSGAGALRNCSARATGRNIEQLGESKSLLLILNLVASNGVGQLVQCVDVILTGRLDPDTVTRTRTRRRDTTGLLSPLN